MATDKQPGRNQTLYHLQVQDAWDGNYWLHLEMRGSATLEDLDFYLREIWLECCGHLERVRDRAGALHPDLRRRHVLRRSRSP